MNNRCLCGLQDCSKRPIPKNAAEPVVFMDGEFGSCHVCHAQSSDGRKVKHREDCAWAYPEAAALAAEAAANRKKVILWNTAEQPCNGTMCVVRIGEEIALDKMRYGEWANAKVNGWMFKDEFPFETLSKMQLVSLLTTGVAKL